MSLIEGREHLNISVGRRAGDWRAVRPDAPQRHLTLDPSDDLRQSPRRRLQLPLDLSKFGQRVVVLTGSVDELSDSIGQIVKGRSERVQSIAIYGHAASCGLLRRAFVGVEISAWRSAAHATVGQAIARAPPVTAGAHGSSGTLPREPPSRVKESSERRQPNHKRSARAIVVLNRIDLRGRPHPSAADLPRPAIVGDEPRSAVRQIIAEVRKDGDASLRALTERFDGVRLDRLRVPEQELDDAVAGLDHKLRAAMDEAIASIEAFHQHQVRPTALLERPGVQIKAYQRAMRRAGLYVPGGRAAYPSTVMMTAVPARVAGVGEIVLCVPPDRRLGTIAPSVLAAARLAGVDEVYAVGGAQAVAAMAYGTASIAPVDVIAGPGNVYVAIAKQEVAGDVGIAAAFAGPSEVIVVADNTVEPTYAAIDLIVQAEHGPDGLAWLVTWDEAVADDVCAAGEQLLTDTARADEVRSTMSAGGYAALVDDEAAAVAVVNAIAPEHLEVQTADPGAFAEQVENAGAIFCGPLAPASVGDYVAGPSHVLPTYGSARFSSALTVADFTKDHHVVTVDRSGLERVGPHVIALAEIEGLHAHAESVRLRLDDERR